MLMTGGKGAIHPDVYKYGRDKSLIFTYVSDEGFYTLEISTN